MRSDAANSGLLSLLLLLLLHPQSVFGSMVDQTGKKTSRYLRTIARSAASLRAESLTTGTPRAVVMERIRSLFNTNISFAARLPGDLAGSRVGTAGCSYRIGRKALVPLFRFSTTLMLQSVGSLW